MTDRSHAPRRVSGENILVLCFAVLTALYVYQTFSLRRTLMSDFVGPALFPQLVGGFGLVLAAIYFLQQRRLDARSAAAGETEAGRAEFSALMPIVPIVFYVLILEPLGFLFSTALYVLVAMLLFGQTIVRSLVYAVTLALAFFVLFYYVLLTELPMGWLIDTEQVLPFLVHIRRAIGG